LVGLPLDVHNIFEGCPVTVSSNHPIKCSKHKNISNFIQMMRSIDMLSHFLFQQVVVQLYPTG